MLRTGNLRTGNLRGRLKKPKLGRPRKPKPRVFKTPKPLKIVDKCPHCIGCGNKTEQWRGNKGNQIERGMFRCTECKLIFNIEDIKRGKKSNIIPSTKVGGFSPQENH